MGPEPVRRVVVWAVVAASLLLMAPTARAQTFVSSCGLVVHGNAALAGDLDCSATAVASAATVFGVLDLRGFTITAPANGRAVICGNGSSCRVKGPGTVVGSIEASYLDRLRVTDLTMIAAATQPLSAMTGGKIALIRVTASGFDSAVQGVGKVKLVDTSLTGTGALGRGVVSQTTARISIIRSSISGFGGSGVSAGRIRLIDSTAVGSGGNPSCVDRCVDLASSLSPRLVGASSCDRSVGPDGPWGVCTNDGVPTTSTTSTTSTTIAACGGGPFACGGACDPGLTCAPISDLAPPYCGCIPDGTQACESETNPYCNGTCGGGGSCGPSGVFPGAACICVPPGGTACGLADFPVCGGFCPSGQECQSFGVDTLEFCACATIGSLCACGAPGTCPGDETCHVASPCGCAP